MNRVCSRGCKCQDRPDNLHCRNPNRRPDSSQGNIAGNFTEDIADGPQGLHVVELVAIQVKIFLHARNEGIVHVRLVEVLYEVSQRRECQDGSIELKEIFSLFRALIEGIPNVSGPFLGNFPFDDIDSVLLGSSVLIVGLCRCHCEGGNGLSKFTKRTKGK